jgi:hypothetical protein
MRDGNLDDAVEAVFDASFATETAYSVFQSKNMLSSGPGRHYLKQNLPLISRKPS